MEGEKLLNESSYTMEELISSMNEKTVKDKFTVLYNQRYINFKNVEPKDINLSKLNRQINEVREILNEVCCTADTTEAVNDRLIISQYLDELITEYMKALNCNSKI